MTSNEQKLTEAFTRDGWTVMHRGWPDFLLVKKTAYGYEKACAVEHKSPHDTLTDEQKRMHSALIRLGIPVYVIRSDASFTLHGKKFLLPSDFRSLAARLADLDTQMKFLLMQRDHLRQDVDASLVIFEESGGPWPLGTPAEQMARRS